MGKIDKDKHDGFVGNVGPVTVTRLKDRVVVKMRQYGTGKPRSKKQKAASKRFGMLTRFVSICNEYVKVGFRNSEKGNAQHAAIAANMERGVAGEWPELWLNYEEMKMSEGNLDGLFGAKAMVDDGRIVIGWDSTMAEGVVNILIYNTDTEEAIVENGVASRVNPGVEIQLPREWCRSGMHVVVYACVSSGNEVSESIYLGMHELGEGGGNYTGKIYKAKKSRRKRRKLVGAEELGDEEKRHVDGVSGKIGPIIAYNYQGITCIKSRYTIKKEPTEKKRQANERFRMLTLFLKSMYEMVKIGYRSESSTMTPLNAAIKRNYGKAFEEGGKGLAFERLVLSVGKLAGTKRLKAWRDVKELVVAWEMSGGESDDTAIVGVYNERCREGHVVMEAGRREDGEVRMKLPDGWKEEDRLHVYLAFVSENDASESGYTAEIPFQSSKQD